MSAIRGPVSKCASEIGSDPTSLCRWNYVNLINGNNKVRMISAHQSVKSSSSLGTIHSQRLRYFTVRGIHTCPRKLFIMHLTQFISSSMALGLEVILPINSNEHAVAGRLTQRSQRLRLAAACCSKFDQEGGPASCFRGRHQIDGIWHARNVTPAAVTLCPFYFSVGDYRVCIVDFRLMSVLGEFPVLLQVSKRRRMICSSETAVKRYLTSAENQLQLHKIPQKIQHLIANWQSLPTSRREVSLNNIDSLTTDLLLHAEKKCRKFRTGNANYSPATSLAEKKWCFWKLLLKHKLRERNSCAELINFTEILAITEFFTLSVETIKKNMLDSKHDCLRHKLSASSKRRQCYLCNSHTNSPLKD